VVHHFWPSALPGGFIGVDVSSQSRGSWSPRISCARSIAPAPCPCRVSGPGARGASFRTLLARAVPAAPGRPADGRLV